MRIPKLLTIYLLMVVFMFTIMACSNARSPMTPVTDDTPDIFGKISEAPDIDQDDRSIIAAYEAVIDPVAETFTITPIREASSGSHLPLTQFYPNCVQITGFGFTPNFWADIRIAHPLPGSGLSVYDPRVIAILPANVQNYFHYPWTGITGNPNIVMEPDGYTQLFNLHGGDIPGNTNPFKAYFKEEPNRVWSSVGNTSETLRWDMNLDGFGGGPIRYVLVVDVTRLGNAPEPVQIEADIESFLTVEGGFANIEVTILDWQGPSGTFVAVEAPDLFNNIVLLDYFGAGFDPDTYIYSGQFSNVKLAPAGYYDILVATLDYPTGILMYNIFEVYVSGEACADPPDIDEPLGGMLPDGYEDSYYEYELTAEHGEGELTWSIIDGNLPDGLTLSSDGWITGVIECDTAGLPYTFTVKVEDSCNDPLPQSDTAMLSLSVLPPDCDPLQLNQGQMVPPARVNQFYFYRFLLDREGEGDLTWELDTELGDEPPAGMELNDDVLTGTPEPGSDGVYMMAVVVRDECPCNPQIDTFNFALIVNP